MAKFDYRLKEKDNTWTAEIVRNVTSRRKMVSKRQGDFSTEAEALAWAEKELVQFSQNQNERNQRKAVTRKANEAIAAEKAEKAAVKKAAYEAARDAEEDEMHDEE
ncbi:MAG: DUF3622 domain-containing protein [Aliivibrio sp.]|uniref:DUF3622 domain-containing protein n=1 Tax=Aliivibrio sp. TaxID=1872443 RepID=UPI001A3698E4|nr:DUF3622 domain-containing protein [Aliivibrio sp.]